MKMLKFAIPTSAEKTILPIQWTCRRVVHAIPISPMGRQSAVYKSQWMRDSYCARSLWGFARRRLILRWMKGMDRAPAMM